MTERQEAIILGALSGITVSALFVMFVVAFLRPCF